MFLICITIKIMKQSGYGSLIAHMKGPATLIKDI